MTSNGAQTPAFGVIHEAGHALIHVEAIESGKTKQYWDQVATDVINMFKDENYVKPEESEVLRRFEIPAAKRAGIPIRTDYRDGFSYETQGSTTTRPTPRGRETIRQSTPGGEK